MAADARINGDADPAETREWLESVDSVVEFEGTDRLRFLLERVVGRAHEAGTELPFTANTAYVNTIPAARQAKAPGDYHLEWRIRCFIRWNALATVVRANKQTNVGGHIASFASSATLYDVGFNHFWHAPSDEHGGDLVYIQGHSAPGHLRPRLSSRGGSRSTSSTTSARRSTGGGLSSYPHPWLMPDFWQFPTVSMGLGPMMAIYQARFMKYLHNRGIVETEGRKVWVFCGDGEMDEPESLGAISLAGREQLDNLVFVINCNLQRLDGPVRGNGKIIQELEADFRGAGWNVIKVIWGSLWDPLLERDQSGLLRRRMEECVDGEYQAFKAKGGAYTREHFFGKYDELKELVANMSDEEIWRLNRGGHDPHKIYAAYHAAVNHKGQPTVILAKTVKGYGMGEAGEGQNITHQQKKMGDEAVRGVPRPLPDPDRRRGARQGALLQAARGQRRDAVSARSGARRSAATCRSAATTSRRSRFPISRRSTRCSRAPASARSRPPWRSCGSSTRCAATRRSASSSCRSCPTSRAPSAWRACSASSASTPPRASSTSPRMPTS